MTGQPGSFDVAKIIPVELPAGMTTPPFAILQEGDSLTLKAYFHWGSGTPLERSHVTLALAQPGASVRYYFEDLEIGGVPIKIPGGPIAKLDATQKAAAFGPGGDLEGSSLPPTDDYWLSSATAPITTGLGNTLQIPTGNDTGTWRVLTYVNGGQGSLVSAFDDNQMIQVIR
jgi:hypothetical protein